ncbi:MAG: alpha-galactosidase [Mucilaginibacter sp.]|nr:alpha-galactosidase [Mucilaginibacter sp.]
MDRRHFVKLSAITTSTLLFSRLTSLAEGNILVMNAPDEVWAQSGKEWFRLKPSSSSAYTYNTIQVNLKQNINALSVYVHSPGVELNAVRLKWKHDTATATKVLGDHWERSYGDLAWKAPDAGSKNPWYVILYDDRQSACFGVKTGCNSICWWAVKNDSIELTMDTQSGGVGVQLGNRQLHAADIITTKSTDNETPFSTTQRFCKLMCPNPRLPKQPVYGINDWYFAYGNNSAKLIKEITALMTDLAPDTNNRPFSVIDAGWATYSPLLPGDGGFMDDFSKPNDKFKDMHQMAADIEKLGMRPGLWTRPLCAKHDDKGNLLLPAIPGRDDPKSPILDPTIEENLERIRYNIITYKKWGYKMVKHDYTTYDIMAKWGFQMTDTLTPSGWKFNDTSRTTAEIINHLYHSIRETAGDMYIIGCNTMSHLSAGVFELNRIGDDTSGKEWDRTRKMGVNTLGFRIPQHNAFYAVDPDCVGLTTDIPWAKNKQWMQLIAESGTPLFISPQPNAVGEEQKAFIKQCFTNAAKVQPIGEPLDWMTNPQPEKWKLNGREVDFDWR